MPPLQNILGDLCRPYRIEPQIALFRVGTETSLFGKGGFLVSFSAPIWVNSCVLSSFNSLHSSLPAAHSLAVIAAMEPPTFRWNLRRQKSELQRMLTPSKWQNGLETDVSHFDSCPWLAGSKLVEFSCYFRGIRCRFSGHRTRNVQREVSRSLNFSL